jgi:hypothetical protein
MICIYIYKIIAQRALTMRILALATVTVAYFASVTAKFSIGACRTDIEQVSFSDYEETAPYPHKLFAMDKGFFGLFQFLEGLGFMSPL